MPPGAASRLREYGQVRLQYLSKRLDIPLDVLESCSKDVSMPPVIADISQEPSSRKRLGNRVMTLLQKSVLWSFNLQRPLLGSEALVAQGVPVYDNLNHGGLFPCPYKSLLGGMPDGCKRSLAVNMICIPLIGQLLCFVMATTERRELLTLRPVHSLVDDGNIDDTELEAIEAITKRQRSYF